MQYGDWQSEGIMREQERETVFEAILYDEQVPLFSGPIHVFELMSRGQNGSSSGQTRIFSIPALTITRIETPGFDVAAGDSAWALMNLILSVAGAVLIANAAIRIAFKKWREKSGDAPHLQESAGDLRGYLLKAAIVLSGICGLMLFSATQDMGNVMVLLDTWSITHAAIFAAGLAGYILSSERLGRGNRSLAGPITRGKLGQSVLE